MKVILSGCTGFIGGVALRHAIRSPDITSIVVLSRRKLEDPEAVNSPKVKTVIVEDFLNYSEDVIKETQGAEAAIWSIGTFNIWDEAYFNKVQSDFTIAAAKFCATSLAPKLPPGKNFRFVRISGTGSVQDQNKRLLLLAKARKMGGRMELELVAMGKEYPKFEVILPRPNAVLNDKRTLSDRVKALVLTHIDVSELGAAVVDLAIHGSEQQYHSNEELADKGRKLLDAKK